MVESTRQTGQPQKDPQEEGQTDFVSDLKNEIQIIGNIIQDQTTDLNRELFTLEKYKNRLLKDKSNPMMSQTKIQKKIEENQAEMAPLVAGVDKITTIKGLFKDKI